MPRNFVAWNHVAFCSLHSLHSSRLPLDFLKKYDMIILNNHFPSCFCANIGIQSQKIAQNEEDLLRLQDGVRAIAIKNCPTRKTRMRRFEIIEAAQAPPKPRNGRRRSRHIGYPKF